MIVHTQKEFLEQLSQRVKVLRLNAGLTQVEFAAKAGIAFPTYKAFERTGRIAVERLYRIALALGRIGEISALFAPPPAASLEELVAPSPGRKRGRRRRPPTP